MSEPTTVAPAGLLAISIAIAGPLAGPYAVIVVASLAGALWALSESETRGRASALLVMRLVLTAVVLTGSATWWLGAHYDVPAHEILSPVAFAIGFFGNRWRETAAAMWGLIASRLGLGGTQ